MTPKNHIPIECQNIISEFMRNRDCSKDLRTEQMIEQRLINRWHNVIYNLNKDQLLQIKITLQKHHDCRPLLDFVEMYLNLY